MKTFGLWMLLFVAITLFLTYIMKDWKYQEILIESTILSYIMYKLLKEELNEK